MNKAPLESQEQQMLFQWANLSQGRYPELALMYHTPNGGKRNTREAAKFQREGVKAGIPDITLPVARKGFHGLYIELKRKHGGVVSQNQEWWLIQLKSEGYAAELCHGYEEAKKVIEWYLGGKK